jgi:glycosyltransferase involved in cell wall biosynthesis
VRHGARVAVVIPAFCEERLVARTIDDIPVWVDSIHPVDDASPDGTWSAIQSAATSRVRPIRHVENAGVGAAIVSGTLAALEAGADVIAVMAGDGQMDPADLGGVVDPVALGRADYVKGNRFVHPERRRMPLLRRLGGRVLSRLTRAATGLDVDDTQCGFTALSAPAARRLPLQSLWPRYGYPNDLLGMLAAQGMRVREVAVRPIYASERSGLRPWHAATIAGLIGRRWLLTQLAIARSTISSAQRSA